MRAAPFTLAILLVVCASSLAHAATRDLDSVTKEQAALEEKQMQAGQPHALAQAMADFRRSAEEVTYPSGQYKLPGYLYKPAGAGPFPAVLWNHGSEKNPRAQPELARFYTQQGYVFFVPIRHGHGPAPGRTSSTCKTRFARRKPTSPRCRARSSACTSCTTRMSPRPSSGSQSSRRLIPSGS